MSRSRTAWAEDGSVLWGQASEDWVYFGRKGRLRPGRRKTSWLKNLKDWYGVGSISLFRSSHLDLRPGAGICRRRYEGKYCVDGIGCLHKNGENGDVVSCGRCLSQNSAQYMTVLIVYKHGGMESTSAKVWLLFHLFFYKVL